MEAVEEVKTMVVEEAEEVKTMVVVAVEAEAEDMQLKYLD